MASLKEIKVRIGSVKSTRKITSAMKMIASSKLHKAQSAITHFLPYQQKLDAILTNLLTSEVSEISSLTKSREIKRVAIVAFSSNSTLCGAYNATIKKALHALYQKSLSLGADNIQIYTIGKQVEQYVQKELKKKPLGGFEHIADKPEFADIEKLSLELMQKYLSGEVDEVKIVYHHFKSVGTQVLTESVFLPFTSDTSKDDSKSQSESVYDYLYEPSRESVLKSLIPNVLNARMFAAALDASASEHAARMMAMQVATENADELIRTLTIQYNKTRQQAVTNEILDIIGGASAL